MAQACILSYLVNIKANLGYIRSRLLKKEEEELEKENEKGKGNVHRVLQFSSRVVDLSKFPKHTLQGWIPCESRSNWCIGMAASFRLSPYLLDLSWP